MTMANENDMQTCQQEIRRLRKIVREYQGVLDDASTIDYQKLFELWGDFDDANAADEVSEIIEESSMGPFDGISFSAFCFGYETAIAKLKEGQ